VSAGPRRVVLTGATRGLGRALTAELASLGHVVLGCGTSEQSVRALRSEHPAPCEFHPVDVSDPSAVEAFASEVLGRHGPPDLLVNNAGILNRLAPVWEVDLSEWRRILEVNVLGTVHLCRAFVPAMVERGSGVVVNVTSGWGRTTSPEVGPYCTTKWAIEGFTRALAQELPRTLAAIPLDPGIIDTEMLRACFGASASQYPGADAWARAAAPYLLGLGPEHSGRPLSVPGF